MRYQTKILINHDREAIYKLTNYWPDNDSVQAPMAEQRSEHAQCPETWRHIFGKLYTLKKYVKTEDLKIQISTQHEQYSFKGNNHLDISMPIFKPDFR